MADRQAEAYRGAGPGDWAELADLVAVPDTAPWTSPEGWEALRWDAARLPPKTLPEARSALTARVYDGSAPDDDLTAYDELLRELDPSPRLLRPLGVGALYVPWLADAARWAGLRVVLVPGHERRGHGGLRAVEVVTGHHTATSDAAAGDYPSLNVVTNGRAGLAGPLCNLGLGRDGTVYVVAAGCAWHAGASRFAGFTDLNDESIGIEAEDNGDGRWTAVQLDAYPRLVAGLLHYMRRGVDRYCSHRTCAVPAGRKPDPAGIADDWMRAQAARVLAGPAPSPSTPVVVPRGAKRMRSVNLANDDGGTPDVSAVLTVDSVGESIVMPAGARVWCQYSAMFPFAGQGAVARVEWLVVTRSGGRPAMARDPFDLKHRGHGSFELPAGAVAVEVVVRGLPKGAAVGWHLDGIGHA